MPLFKLPFEEKRPITVPPAGQAQPLAERVTGLIGVFGAAGLGAATVGRVKGGGVGTGFVTMGGVLGADAGGAVSGRVATARGTWPLKRIVWPG